jgi:hypothetical protein
MRKVEVVARKMQRLMLHFMGIHEPLHKLNSLAFRLMGQKRKVRPDKTRRNALKIRHVRRGVNTFE